MNLYNSYLMLEDLLRAYGHVPEGGVCKECGASYYNTYRYWRIRGSSGIYIEGGVGYFGDGTVGRYYYNGGKELMCKNFIIEDILE